MSSQDRLENVLRDFHVMISKSEVCDTDRIIVSKNAIFDLIDRLNACIYEIMDEYEMTQQSRDRALREHKKEGDKIIWDASRQAEDIYAASVMYTQEALGRLNRVVEEANMTISHLYREFGDSMKQQQETIRENELELKSQLQLLSDTEKYISLIEERNREIEREEAEKKGRKVVHSSEKISAVKPEIKINEEYFRKAGIPLDDYVEKEPMKEEEVQALPDEGVVESSYKKVEVTGSQKITETGSVVKEKASQQYVNRKYSDQENYKKRNVSQENSDQGHVNQETISQENINKNSVDQENAGQSVVGQEYIDQSFVGQECVNQNTVDQESVNQGIDDEKYMDQGIDGKEYTDQDTVRQESNNQGVVGQENLQRGNVTQEYIEKSTISQEYIGQDADIQEYTSQGVIGQKYIDQGIDGQEYIGQEYADQRSIDYEITGRNVTGQKITSQEKGRQKRSGHEIQVEDLELEEDETPAKEELSFFDRLMGKKKN